MPILKEKVSYRLKAYNVTQMVSFVITRLEEYYIRRLTDVANNRVKRITNIQREHEDVDCEAIVQVCLSASLTSLLFSFAKLLYCQFLS